jgi:peptidoglycan-associated lipoprotein
MSIRKILVVCLVLFVAGCACRTKSVGHEVGHIPAAGVESPLQDVRFAFDSYEVSSSAAALLRSHAEWLNANPGVNVQIEGHCDERGTSEYNMVLGRNRAEAVREYLRGLGISADRMSTVSYGKELPLDPRSNEEAWAKNRRAHFNVQG